VQALRRDLALNALPSRAADSELFGVELEVIPLAWSERPTAVPLGPRGGEDPGLLEVVAEWAEAAGLEVVRPGGAPDPASDAAGRFTFEPGGQVEFSSAPCTTPAATWRAAEEAVEGLGRLLADRAVRTISVGANPWQGAGEIPLQTLAPRYECMAAYFASISPAGEHMMRRTCAVHVNVDLGTGDRARARWRAAQLLSPLALATFGFSPVERGRASGWKSLRGRSWLRLDPSRTGFPRTLVDQSEEDPVAQYLELALSARVMMFRGPGAWEPALVPLSFASWLEHGHEGQFPTLDDWHYHLTTLFPEVRPKGYLELRSGDAQAGPFRAVPLVWWVALLCDDRALEAVLARLEATAATLPERRARAAESGCSDPELATDVGDLWRFAADALERAPAGWFDAPMRAATQAFGELFAERGRAPADDVLAICAEAGAFTPDGWDALIGRWSAAVASAQPR